ncbi:hypothetical protein BH09ACT12_BH09ACT12_33640 [soil metagenome]
MSLDETELHAVLHRATESIDAPVLAGRALAGARRRRTQRRGVVAAAASSAVVVAVVVAVNVGGTTSVAPPTSPSETPTLPSSTPTEPTEPTEVADGSWDPRTVDDLAAADPGIAPALPDVIEPPDSSPLLSEEPIDAAVLAVEEGDVAQVLGVDGSWRSVPLDQRYPGLQLSPDGTRLAVSYYGGDVGATIHDLATGESRVLEFPEGYRPFDGTYWTFADNDTLCLCGADEVYLVDATTGAGEPLGHGADLFDPNGAALEVDCCVGPEALTDWADGTPREVSLKRIGRPSSIRVSADSVASTSYDLGPLQVVLSDRRTLTPTTHLPIQDPQGAFGDGGLSVLSIAGDDTVLLRVSVLGKNGDGFRVVAWDPASNALSLVSTNPVTRQVAFAEGLLRSR